MRTVAILGLAPALVAIGLAISPYIPLERGVSLPGYEGSDWKESEVVKEARLFVLSEIRNHAAVERTFAPKIRYAVIWKQEGLLPSDEYANLVKRMNESKSLPSLTEKESRSLSRMGELEDEAKADTIKALDTLARIYNNLR